MAELRAFCYLVAFGSSVTAAIWLLPLDHLLARMFGLVMVANAVNAAVLALLVSTKIFGGALHPAFSELIRTMDALLLAITPTGVVLALRYQRRVNGAICD